MQTQKESNQRAWSIISIVITLSFLYAIIRYNIAGEVPWKDLVFFVLNKALAMGSIVILCITFGLWPMKKLGLKISDKWQKSAKVMGFMGFIMVIIHVFMSLLLFKPSIYHKFFEPDHSLTFFAGLSMLGGVLSFVLYWMYNISFNSNFRNDKDMNRIIPSRELILLAMFFSGIHLFFMGFEGWLTPAKWNGGLPPISLLSFSILMAGMVVNIFGRR